MSDINLKILSGEDPNAVATEILAKKDVTDPEPTNVEAHKYPGTDPIVTSDGTISDCGAYANGSKSTETMVGQNAVDVDTAGKLKIGAVARLVALIVAAINQFCAIFGLYQIPNIGEAGTNVVALVLSIIATGVAYWFNNSWTGNANLCDVILDALDAQDISVSDILEVLAKISKTKENNE